MKIAKTVFCITLLVVIAGCSATPTRRAFKEGWRDSAITSKVKWRLGRDKVVKAHNIDVDTWRGVVTLTGRMTSEEEKAQAEKVASGVKNVKQVRNLLDVVGPESVPQKVVKENIPFSKPAGKFDKPQDIAVPTIDQKKSVAKSGEEAKTRGIDETELEKEIGHQDGVSNEIGKELAATVDESLEKGAPADDVTLQAEQELKELKARKGK